MIPIRELTKTVGKITNLEFFRRIDAIDVRKSGIESLRGPDVVQLYRNIYLHDGLYIASEVIWLWKLLKTKKVSVPYEHKVYLLEWKDNKFAIRMKINDRADWHMLAWIETQRYYEKYPTTRHKDAMIEVLEEVIGMDTVTITPRKKKKRYKGKIRAKTPPKKDLLMEAAKRIGKEIRKG